jgi:hypothetical protein
MDTDKQEPFSPQDMVNASELREFVFCERAWFLSGQGQQVTAKAQSQREDGIAFHEARAEAARRGSRPKAYAWALLLAVAAVALLVATILADGK